MMREYARLRGLRRLLLPVPLLTPHLSGLWLALVTPAQARIGRALVEGLRNSTVVRSTAARDAFRIEPMPLRAALTDAIEEGTRARLKIDTRTTEVDVPPAQAFAPIRRIGGATGWYFGTLLWSARGWLDRLFGGVGMGRGRRDPEHCVEKDVIDGWTVEAYEPDRRLRLSADLRLPGRGWLEFEVTPLDAGRRSMIRQTATFDPRGLLGRAYWYAVLPIHGLMFRGMLGRIAERASAAKRRRPCALHPPLGHSRERRRSVSVARTARSAAGPDPVASMGPNRKPDGGSARRWPRRVFIRHRAAAGVLGGPPLRLCQRTAVLRRTGPRAVQDLAAQHRIEATGPGDTLYEDRIEYAVPGGPVVNRLARPFIRRLLVRSFARRHDIVHASFSGVLTEGPPPPPVALT